MSARLLSARPRRSAGFTLLELMVVLVLIGIIFSFAVLSLRGTDVSDLMEQETRRLAFVRQQNGMATPLEVLDADLALIRAKGQWASALYTGDLALAALEFSVGMDLNTVPLLGREMELDND